MIRTIGAQAAYSEVTNPSMHSIARHLTETAGWRALFTKKQFLAKTEPHPDIDEYLVRLLFRATKARGLAGSPAVSAKLHNFRMSLAISGGFDAAG